MSRTAKTIIISSLLALGVSAHAMAGEVKTIDATNFDRISLDGLIDLNVIQGKTFKVEAAGTDEALERVKFKVDDGELVVDNSGEEISINRLSDIDDYTVTINVTMPDLTGLEVDGLVDIVITDMKLDDIRVDVDGKADIEMTGSCNEAEFRVDGLSQILAKKFECKSVDVRLDGIGSARVYASEEVDARVDGLAKITVYGEPEKRRVSADGFGGVSFVD
ncbi:MAG: DUF2807 domain-containing protein [Sphingomonadales bacterium]|nr:DUF2807 domain-containing protein [Sphingomonadales bacterium]